MSTKPCWFCMNRTQSRLALLKYPLIFREKSSMCLTKILIYALHVDDIFTHLWIIHAVNTDAPPYHHRCWLLHLLHGNNLDGLFCFWHEDANDCFPQVSYHQPAFVNGIWCLWTLLHSPPHVSGHSVLGLQRNDVLYKHSVCFRPQKYRMQYSTKSRDKNFE